MKTGKTFYIVDCNYYFRASYFALPPIFSTSGNLVNAVYGFTATLLKLIRRHPFALAIAGDADGRYFRHDLLPSYKSEKKPVPNECNEQAPFLRRILDVMNIPYLSVEGFEADDIIATLTVKARDNGNFTYICSRDKDLYQLLAEDIVVLDITSGKEMTYEIMQGKLGIFPHQIPDMLALTGDKVDSIPGIPGIGVKTAAKLLNTYIDLENLIRHREELSAKLRNNIGEYCDQALLAKRLASLRTDVHIEVPFSTLKFQLPNISIVEPVFKELGMEALLTRLENTLSSMAC